MSFSLKIEDQGLDELTCLPSCLPFDFNWFMLCPWAMLFFQKLCPALVIPVSCSFLEPHPGPQCCLYNLLEGQPENSWPLGEKHCVICSLSRYSGLHLTCFLAAFLSELAGVDYRQPSVGRIPSRATGLPGTISATLGVSPAGH